MAIAEQPITKRRQDDEEFYPSGDGKPMAETQQHVNQMLYSISTLTVRYAEQSDVYVAGNNFLYYEEGNRHARVSPDTYVVFGVSKAVRKSYFAWKEGGRLPAIVFEFTSKSTRREDTQRKFTLYEQVLRVPEYVLSDPLGEYLKPRLQGYRRVNGVYQPIPLKGDRLHSEQLELDLVMDGEMMRFYDPVRGEWLLSPLEQAQRIEAEARARAAEARRAEAAEAEVARLRAEIEALKRQAGE